MDTFVSSCCPCLEAHYCVYNCVRVCVCSIQIAVKDKIYECLNTHCRHTNRQVWTSSGPDLKIAECSHAAGSFCGLSSTGPQRRRWRINMEGWGRGVDKVCLAPCQANCLASGVSTFTAALYGDPDLHRPRALHWRRPQQTLLIEHRILPT